MNVVHEELSVVVAAVRPVVFAIAVLLSVLIQAMVPGAPWLDLDPHPVLLIVFPGPFLFRPV
jgi:hypothetical protein